MLHALGSKLISMLLAQECLSCPRGVPVASPVSVGVGKKEKEPWTGKMKPIRKLRVHSKVMRTYTSGQHAIINNHIRKQY